jgi:hypothetical protein
MTKKIFSFILVLEILSLVLFIAVDSLIPSLFLQVLIGLILIAFAHIIGPAYFRFTHAFSERLRQKASKLAGFEIEKTLFSYSNYPFSRSRNGAIWGIRLLGVFIIAIVTWMLVQFFR